MHSIWIFDFSALPKYDVRDKAPYVYDKFFEISESDALCGIYSIVEASMLNYIGALVLLKNKSEPRVVLNVSENINFTDNFSRSADGRYIFLQASFFDKAKKRIDRPIVVFDLLKERFSIFKTENLSPAYEIVEIKKGVFKAIADEVQKKSDKRLRRLTKKKIRLNWLRWHVLDQFETFIMR